MKKNDYLDQEPVKDFIKWMGAELEANVVREHGYTRPKQPPLAFRNLADAFARYDWRFNFLGMDGRRRNGRTFDQNAAVLGTLQQNLREALGRKDADDAACAAAIDVVRWGGVRAHTEDWMRADPKRLAEQLRAVKAAFAQDDDEAELPAELRFNAGMTKVYSLLIDHFIIYDSRVAGALAWFIATWAARQQMTEIPAPLRFPCMAAKEAPNARLRKLRNPCEGESAFPPLRNHARKHALWNLRASWIIEALLAANPSTHFGAGTDGSRAVEAALFMWGYHLTPVALNGPDAPAGEPQTA